MFEKVNPAHPDKVADRIAGAMVDLAYRKNNQPKIAVEVLIGHGVCHIITETSVHFFMEEVLAIVERIAGPMEVDYKESAQDVHLAVNQHHKMRCGDNGIFKGTPVTAEQRDLTKTAERIYDKYLCDGKYIITNNHLIICQSNAPKSELRKWFPDAEINPLGDWTGGTDVDTGATNRKLGSDMGDSITGGGLARLRYGRQHHGRRSSRQRPLESRCQCEHLSVACCSENRQDGRALLRHR